MALILKDRIKETTTTAGLGTLTLAGSADTFEPFSTLGDGNTTYYAIVAQGNDNWEVGIGTVGTGTLSRDTVLASSNAGAKINFPAGTKDVFVTLPGAKIVSKDDATGIDSGISLADYVDFDTAADAAGAVGRLKWNDQDGTLDLGVKGGNVTLQIGQEQLIRIVNKTGSDLLEADYQCVKISGAQGQRPKVGLAQANNDVNSSDTIGLVTETISNNQEGFVTTSGIVRNINTTGSLQSESWNDGDVLYLSGTNAGQLTNVKPQAPIHTVIVGFVIHAHITQGKIFVKVDNGYEIDELHNVKINGVTNGQVLTYNNGLWENQTNGSGTVTSVAVSAGTGISVSGSPITSSGTLTITNTAPDQVVSLTAGSNVTVTGTYPNFTIAATGGGGSGTVTDVSVVSANGFSGSVATATTTPAITLSTSISGLLKGSAGALAAASASDVPDLPQSKITNLVTDLAAKAPLASPALTGTPTAPTAAVGTDTTQLATTAFVNAEIANDAPSKTGTGASGTWGISVTGNAGTATTLATARTLTIGATGKTFDGSANVSWTLGEIGAQGALALTTTGTSGASTLVGNTLNIPNYAGTVTSVGLSLPTFITVTNSPVTGSGTLTGTLASQTANTVFVAPDGTAGAPTFRALVEADIPTLSQAKITNLTTDLSAKAPLASPALTGTPTAPTATVGTNTTQIATTAFVNAEIANDAVLLTGDQTIGGTKTFSSTISGSISGNAGTVTDGVYTTGDQTIAGVKTFSGTSAIVNNNLGVGVSPTYKVDVLTAGNSVARFRGASNGFTDFTNGTGTLRVQMLSNVPHIGSYTNHNLNIITNNAVRATFDTSGNLSVTGNATIGSGSTVGGIVIGYRDVPVTIQNATYTFALADAGKAFGKDNTTAYTYTIPANASVAFPIGTVITVFNNNATSNITVAITTDTLRLAGTTTTGSRTVAPFSLCTLFKVSSTVWMASGAGVT